MSGCLSGLSGSRFSGLEPAPGENGCCHGPGDEDGGREQQFNLEPPRPLGQAWKE
ncbi:hypothetical protein [Neomoorella thermoacetica]|uniref:hypothetical protein n=1 Tax=Neomoorella thermoacetica TaxID=1525 RepID=UPI00130EBCA4|nr:hypothetical protein [Moorella thermoacetica]